MRYLGRSIVFNGLSDRMSSSSLSNAFIFANVLAFEYYRSVVKYCS